MPWTFIAPPHKQAFKLGRLQFERLGYSLNIQCGAEVFFHRPGLLTDA